MRSIKFPNMFNSNSTNVWEADEYINSTYQNSILVLLSQRGELIGDPYFGVLLRHYLYQQNGPKLQDYIVDAIYVQLALFIPQLRIDRNDIKLIRQPQKGKITCSFKGINQINYEVDTYNILIFKQSNQ